METVAVSAGARPFVVARWDSRPGAPTLLVYAHYDVQPADRREGWTSPPFCAVRRGDYLVGRGTADDKGPVVAHIAAVEAWLRSCGALPLNVVFLLDGEEEVGSPSVRRWLRSGLAPLAADAVVVPDAATPASGRPALVRSLRGLLVLKITLDACRPELHSGTANENVRNPVEELCRIVAGLQDGRGRVTVPGFYARVRRLTPHRPAVAATGIAGGYTGPGAKSVVPARATAVLEIRLVESQRPDEILASFKRYLRTAARPDLDVSVRVLKSSRPVELELENAPGRAAARALQTAFGIAPAIIASGGTMHVIPTLLDTVEAPVVVIGLAGPDARRHGPDERLYLPTFARTTNAAIALLHELSQAGAAW